MIRELITFFTTGNKRKHEEMEVEDSNSQSNKTQKSVVPKFKPIDVESFTVRIAIVIVELTRALFAEKRHRV